MEKYFEGLKQLAITVCDTEGNILDMNQRSADVNSNGQKIVGNNLFGCHPERAAAILKDLLDNEKLNAYTIEKNGVKKLIYQVPWYQEDGSFGGLIEFSLPIPFEMPHYVRQPKN
ncbi:MAG: diguanylate cyclase [Bacteroidales bacterium]|nr:diguanylate cyclase [Candidatus Colimorpha pelethequi]